MRQWQPAYGLVAVRPWRVRRIRARLLRPLRWRVEYELIEGQRAPWATPAWATSPAAGIIGTWRMRRRRLTLWYMPIWRWQTR